MQALSFAVHIPLVCFGIAFPSLVLLVEWLHLRTGDPLYRDAGPPLVEGHARPVRRRRGHRNDPLLRDGVAVARLHGRVRRRVRPGLRARGLFVLRGGDLHRHLRLRLGPPVPAAAFPLRDPDRRRRRHRIADGDLGQCVDAEPGRLPAARGRPGRRRRAGQGAVRQPLPVAAAHPHVHRRLPRRRLPAGRRVRRALAPRATAADTCAPR